jgi:hypothetical protein
MARAQQQGVSAVTVWMIVFVVLWLTSTVLLVLLYTGQEELKTENRELLAQKQRAVSDSELRSIDLIKQASDRKTAVGLLEEARAATAELATGVKEDDPGTVGSKLTGTLDRIRGDGYVANERSFRNTSLFEALTLLYEEFSESHALLNEMESRTEELEGRVADLTKINQEQKDELDKQAGELTARLAEIEADRGKYREDRDVEVARLERELDDRRAQADADLTAERQRRLELEDRYTELQNRFAQLQAKSAGMQITPEKLVTARQPDGHIVSAIPGDESVYIDLGRRDRLTLGLEFAVYSAEMGIPDDGKAKARIEVVSISGNASECRILSVRPGAVILEGDLIANPIYDRDRALTFMVVGRFDLDRDGLLDAAGADSIEALVTGWGGTTTNELSALTDFLVLGAAPARPGTAPEDQAQNSRLQQQYDNYVSVVQAANSLAVPVLTQDVFLQFLGYQRHDVRR